MSTGAEFANITNKRLMSFQDFADRTIGYLRELNREVTEKLFDEGAFREKLPIDSPGANQVRLNAKPIVGGYVVHDGSGHILDLQNDNTAVFENNVAVAYEVGAGFAKKPSGIVINPRTGKPDYERYVESVGDESEPNSVTDNGSNITFRVDNLVANSGESIASRTVRVFKKIPADGATSESIAVEELLVSFGGGQNTITTSGLLGQATVSTTPGDYLVQLVGISVRRSTNPEPLSASDVHFFAGTVTGNGGTPTSFDNGPQQILKAEIVGLTTVSRWFGPTSFKGFGASPNGWEVDVTTAYAETIADGADLIAAIPAFPLGTRVTGVRARVQPGAARSFPNNIRLDMAYTEAGADGSSSFAGDVRDDGTTNTQWLDMPLTPFDMEENREYYIVINGGDDAGTNPDKFYGFEVTYEGLELL